MQARPNAARLSRSIRFQPIVHLERGVAVGAMAEVARLFDETPRFGPVGMIAAEDDVFDALVTRLKDTAALAALTGFEGRPIHVPMEIAALLQPGLADTAAEALAGTSLCVQEVCLMIPDPALLHARSDAFNAIHSLRRVGFRVGIDATASWQGDPSEGLSLMTDCLAVDATAFDRCDKLGARVRSAAETGVAVIARGPLWRDAEWLAKQGISHGTQPRSDA